MSAPESPDWDVADSDPPDPEDVSDADGRAADLDDVPEDVPESAEDAGQEVLFHPTEETIPWQEYLRPVPD